MGFWTGEQKYQPANVPGSLLLLQMRAYGQRRMLLVLPLLCSSAGSQKIRGDAGSRFHVFMTSLAACNPVTSQSHIACIMEQVHFLQNRSQQDAPTRSVLLHVRLYTCQTRFSEGSRLRARRVRTSHSLWTRHKCTDLASRIQGLARTSRHRP